MQELSLNVLDIAQNSVRAGASLIEITVDEQPAADTLTITVRDDGCGMTPEQVRRVTDPFFTTRTTRRVGLGVPFLKMGAEMTGGSLSIESEPGRGTAVTAVFGLTHIDRMPGSATSRRPSPRSCSATPTSISPTPSATGRGVHRRTRGIPAGARRRAPLGAVGGRVHRLVHPRKHAGGFRHAGVLTAGRATTLWTEESYI